MNGDKVIVGTGYFWKESDGEKVMAYMPRLDENKQWILTPDNNSVVVQSVGGVLAGSSGQVQGNIIKVQRGYFSNLQKGFGAATDFVELVPVYLEKYQRLGYFLVDNVRILGG